MVVQLQGNPEGSEPAEPNDTQETHVNLLPLMDVIHTANKLFLVPPAAKEVPQRVVFEGGGHKIPLFGGMAVTLISMCDLLEGIDHAKMDGIQAAALHEAITRLIGRLSRLDKLALLAASTKSLVVVRQETEAERRAIEGA